LFQFFFFTFFFSPKIDNLDKNYFDGSEFSDKVEKSKVGVAFFPFHFFISLFPCKKLWVKISLSKKKKRKEKEKKKRCELIYYIVVYLLYHSIEMKLKEEKQNKFLFSKPQKI